jgi:SAM-dependent methyltransferase
MKAAHLDLLACPDCGSGLRATSTSADGDELTSGSLACTSGGHTFPIVDGVPRFVAPDNYAGNFGWQWNRYRRTQLDSHSGTTISRDRFVASTGWTREMLAGRRVLDVGCGAGRFAEVALDFGADVVALDYSSAVDACYANHAANPRFSVVQGDIYRLPVRPGSFDFVYCLGVLQHTPDVENAFRALVPPVRQGGRLAVDVYPKFWQTIASAKYWVRPVTTRMRQERLFRLIERSLPVLLPVSSALGAVPRIGRKLRQLIPVSNYAGIYPLNPGQVREWALLDTFDMLAPAFDQPQTARTLRQWLDAAGLEEVEVFRHGHLIGRGRRPAASAR